jgi:ribosomal-protein-alanine N-acetyltransferase
LDAISAPVAGVKIVQASWRDLKSLVALEKICFGRDAWPWMDILAALTFPEMVHLIATASGQIVGFVAGDRRGREGLAWISTLSVHPDFRRLGIGRELLQRAEEELGMDRIRLTLRASNRAAFDLYRQLNYQIVDIWRNYYRDKEDGLVMEKVRR